MRIHHRETDSIVCKHTAGSSSSVTGIFQVLIESWLNEEFRLVLFLSFNQLKTVFKVITYYWKD